MSVDEVVKWFEDRFPPPIHTVPGPAGYSVPHANWDKHIRDAALRVTERPLGTDLLRWAKLFANGPVYSMIEAWVAERPDLVVSGPPTADPHNKINF